MLLLLSKLRSKCIVHKPQDRSRPKQCRLSRLEYAHEVPVGPSSKPRAADLHSSRGSSLSPLTPKRLLCSTMTFRLVLLLQASGYARYIVLRQRCLLLLCGSDTREVAYLEGCKCRKLRRSFSGGSLSSDRSADTKNPKHSCHNACILTTRQTAVPTSRGISPSKFSLLSSCIWVSTRTDQG
jgi:hypothetical protein